MNIESIESNIRGGKTFFVPTEKMANHCYEIAIRPYLLGQFRIQLIAATLSDDVLPGEGPIVREMCTYIPDVAFNVACKLANSDDPEAEAESLVRRWNCEYPGGRIRLDSEERHDVTRDTRRR